MKRVISILMLSALCICAGFAVSYYNTSSLGYDNANILSFNDEEIRIFDVYINYNSITDFLDEVKDSLPDKFITISCNV